MRPFRIFLASPGDVAEERAIVRKVVDRLRHESRFSDHFNLLVIAWDQPGLGVALDAAITPQMAIERGLKKPSECDLTVVMAWARMGTPLPDEYRKPDGSRYASGTEYEFCDALESYQRAGSPLLWVYRRTEKPGLVELDDPEYDAKRRQWEDLKGFFDRFTTDDGALLGGVNTYATPADFGTLFERHLRAELEARLAKPEEPLERPPRADLEARPVEPARVEESSERRPRTAPDALSAKPAGSGDAFERPAKPPGPEKPPERRPRADPGERSSSKRSP